MIVFMGTPAFAVPILEMLIKENYPVGLVITQPDKKVGRKQALEMSPVKKVALEHGIKVFQPLKLKESYQEIIDMKPDFIITAAYGQILPKALLQKVRGYNMHGSILPKYRGGAPIQYALFNQDAQTGVTLMEMVFKMDAGDIIDIAYVDITQADNYATLTEKLSIAGAQLLKEYMPKIISKTYQKRAQNESEVTFAYTLKYEDEWLDFEKESKYVLGRIAGLSPQLGAIARLDDATIKIYKAQKSDIIKVGKPGEIYLDAKRMFIKTRTDWIEVLEVKQEGKKKMDIKAYLNGQNLFKSGDQFEIKGGI